MDQPSSKLSKVVLDVDTSKFHNWLKPTGVRRVQRCITSNLFLDHKRNKVDFTLDQIGGNRKTFKIGFNTIHEDKAWFNLIRDK